MAVDYRKLTLGTIVLLPDYPKGRGPHLAVVLEDADEHGVRLARSTSKDYTDRVEADHFHSVDWDAWPYSTWVKGWPRGSGKPSIFYAFRMSRLQLSEVDEEFLGEVEDLRFIATLLSVWRRYRDWCRLGNSYPLPFKGGSSGSASTRT